MEIYMRERVQLTAYFYDFLRQLFLFFHCFGYNYAKKTLKYISDMVNLFYHALCVMLPVIRPSPCRCVSTLSKAPVQ